MGEEGSWGEGGGRRNDLLPAGVVVRVESFFCSINFCYFFVLSLHLCICVISVPEKAIILLFV